jgi:Flp pilus assembly protein protease CpaA
MMLTIISLVAFIGLIIASYTDLKKREVPDWLNFSLVGLGLGIRLLWSLITNDYSFIIAGVLGFVAFFLIALLMFYTGQWGGGDSKMIMGLGALIGLEFSIDSQLFSFIVNTVIVGSIYGLLWSISLVFFNLKKFLIEFKKIKNSLKKQLVISLIIFFILLLSAFIIRGALNKLIVITLIVVLYSSLLLILFIKSVERSCMLKYVTPKELTEGDWIAKDIIIKHNKIAGPKDLGIEKSQIKKLIQLYNKGKIKKVLIKVGIPFVPSFLIAYLLTMLSGNLLYLLIR